MYDYEAEKNEMKGFGHMIMAMEIMSSRQWKLR